MNIRNIKQLAQIAREFQLSALDIEEEGIKISIRREAPVRAAITTQPGAISDEDMVISTGEVMDPGMNFNAIRTVDAPMVGIFYQASSPEAQPYVQVGSRVKKGDVLCIIEAMKLFNEIKAPEDGEIVDICVSSGDVVEFGQTLFKIF